MGSEEAQRNCWKQCEYKENRTAFLSVATVFGGIYALSMVFLGVVIDERLQGDSITPNFPASVNTLWSNFPLRRFLWPAVLDTAILYILFPFLPYFVQYVLDPFSYCKDAEFYDNIKCRSTYWTGFLVVSYIAGALIALPVWMAVMRSFQKKVAWGLTSILQVFALPILAACRDQYMVMAMILFFVIGLFQNGSFMQRSILGDIIDYDEMLQLRRCEGTYVGYSLVYE